MDIQIATEDFTDGSLGYNVVVTGICGSTIKFACSDLTHAKAVRTALDSCCYIEVTKSPE